LFNVELYFLIFEGDNLPEACGPILFGFEEELCFVRFEKFSANTLSFIFSKMNAVERRGLTLSKKD
jgi:hypothetical protein